MGRTTRTTWPFCSDCSRSRRRRRRPRPWWPLGAGGMQVREIFERLQHSTKNDDGDADGDGDVVYEEDEDARAREEEGVGFGAEEDVQQQDVFTALSLLDFEALRALVAADPEVITLRDPHDLSMPLAVAIAARFDRGVKLLLSQQEPNLCPLTLVDGRGYSALHLAVEAYDDMPFLAQFLLQYRGADINCRAPPAPVGDGTAPLHAVPPDNIKALRLLLASGADPSIRDGEGRTALDVVCATWGNKQAKKRARHLLTRRSPFQAYALHKLRFLTRSRSQGHGDEKERRQGMEQQPSLSSSSSSKVDDRVAGLYDNTMEKLLEMRLASSDTQYADLEEEGRGGGEEAEDSSILCRLETAGVYSFISDAGHLCLARVDRSVSPLQLLLLEKAGQGGGGEGKPAAAGPVVAAASASSSATTSPSSSPTTTPEAPTAGGPVLPTWCPLSRLKAARAAVFDLGKADEETVLARQPLVGAEEGKDAPWVVVPSMPRPHVIGALDEEAVAVLYHVVYDLEDESVFDALEAFLWR